MKSKPWRETLPGIAVLRATCWHLESGICNPKDTTSSPGFTIHHHSLPMSFHCSYFSCPPSCPSPDSAKEQTQGTPKGSLLPFVSIDISKRVKGDSTPYSSSNSCIKIDPVPSPVQPLLPFDPCHEPPPCVVHRDISALPSMVHPVIGQLCSCHDRFHAVTLFHLVKVYMSTIVHHTECIHNTIASTPRALMHALLFKTFTHYPSTMSTVQ